MRPPKSADSQNFGLMQPFYPWLFLTSLILISSVSASEYAEHQLISNFLRNYPMAIARPLRNASQAVVVKFRMQLLSVEIDEKYQAISILSWDTLEWVDQYLIWNPREYSTLAQIYLKSDMIWTPDITLFNTAGEPESKYNKASAKVMHDGTVTWTRTVKHTFPCKFNFASFPFDTFSCVMNFGSTIYDGYKIDLKLDGISLSSYTSNVRWGLRKADSEKIVTYYECCPEPYITLVFRLSFQRHATYYIYTLLIPTFLLSLFTLVLYLLPYHRPEKITLGITLFGAFFILLMTMQVFAPVSETIPYFVFYLCFNLCLLALSTFLNLIIINMASRENLREVPRPLRCISEFFARLLCISSVVRKIQSRHLLSGDIGIPPLANNYYTLPLQDKKLQNTEADRDSLCDEDQPESVSHRFVDQRRFESDMAVIKTFTKRYQERLTDEEGEKRQLSEWKDVAKVTNRLFFVLCFLIDIGAIAAYLFLAICSW